MLPDQDTGVDDFAGYRVYRQAGSRFATWEVSAEGAASTFAATINGTERIFVSRDVVSGTECWYSVTAVDDGTQNWTELGISLESGRWWTWSGFIPYTGITPNGDPIGVSRSAGPSTNSLLANTPNPFNPTTTLHYQVATDTDVSSVVYNMAGQAVRKLVSRPKAAGFHSGGWGGRDGFGRDVASGVYLARFVAGDVVQTRRMVLIR